MTALVRRFVAVCAAFVAGAAVAAAATGPELDRQRVEQVALSAAQFHPFSAYQPDPRLSVNGVRVVHATRGGYVWYVRVWSSTATFPCRLPPPGSPAPSCPPDPLHPRSQAARVEIADSTGRVLSFTPLPWPAS